MTIIFFVGSVTTLPFHLWEIARGDPMPASWTALWAAGFIAIFTSLLAQYFWTGAVERVGARTAGYFIYLTPVFGAAAAIVLLGEKPGWFHLAGCALIFAGIWLATTARSGGPLR
jgi:drug/metabolite transporter (DMT)-like permease